MHTIGTTRGARNAVPFTTELLVLVASALIIPALSSLSEEAVVILLAYAGIFATAVYSHMSGARRRECAIIGGLLTGSLIELSRHAARSHGLQFGVELYTAMSLIVPIIALLSFTVQYE